MRRSGHPARRGSPPRRASVIAGPYSGRDIVRLLERQGFVAGEDGAGGSRVYEHPDGRMVIAQPTLPACVRPGDRVFNLLAYDLRVSPNVLLRLFVVSGADRG